VGVFFFRFFFGGFVLFFGLGCLIVSGGGFLLSLPFLPTEHLVRTDLKQIWPPSDGVDSPLTPFSRRFFPLLPPIPVRVFLPN